jgi:hypothetical protein
MIQILSSPLHLRIAIKFNEILEGEKQRVVTISLTICHFDLVLQLELAEKSNEEV